MLFLTGFSPMKEGDIFLWLVQFLKNLSPSHGGFFSDHAMGNIVVICVLSVPGWMDNSCTIYILFSYRNRYRKTGIHPYVCLILETETLLSSLELSLGMGNMCRDTDIFLKNCCFAFLLIDNE